MRHLTLLAAVSLLSATSAFAAVEYRNSFEGNGPVLENVGGSFLGERWTRVATPVAAEGMSSVRVELLKDDIPFYVNADGGGFQQIRTSVNVGPDRLQTPALDGLERYYGWSFRHRANPPLDADKEFLVMFWESIEPYNIVSALFIKGDQMRFSTWSQKTNTADSDIVTQWEGQVTPGVWHRFIMRVKWSIDPEVGAVDLFLDGKKVVDNVKFKTLRVDTANKVLNNNWNHGLLYSPRPTMLGQTVIFLDDLRSGTTYDDVDAVVVVPPDAGMPMDAGEPVDAGQPIDAGMPAADAGKPKDAGMPVTDAGPKPSVDASTPQDSGQVDGEDAGSDGGLTTGISAETSCGCQSMSGAWVLAAASTLLLARRRRHG
jgi:Polysaccharide lyase